MNNFSSNLIKRYESFKFTDEKYKELYSIFEKREMIKKDIGHGLKEYMICEIEVVMKSWKSEINITYWELS